MSEGGIELRGAVRALWDTFCDEVLVEGPAGCVAGETELWDPTTCTGRRIDELCWAGESAWVETMDGPKLAGVPFVKGIADLHRVWLENSESCLVTPDHLLLTRDGWKYSASLVEGMEVLSRPMNAGGEEWSAVESVKFERRDWYYDLEVPGAKHYLADGIYHHNTGKTRGLLERCYYLGEKFPGCRILWVRQTLKSLRQSVMVTWEEEVLGKNSPYLNGTAKRSTRDSYVHENGTEIVLAGADTPEKFLSTQYDFIFIWEAIEVSHDTVQVLTSRNRNGKAPFQQIIFDTNPGPRTHHLNKRFPEQGYRELPADHPARRIRPFEDHDQLVRLKSKHQDNPGFFAADGTPHMRWGPYGRKLNRLSGSRRRNLRDGEWASMEGVILESYSEDVHLVDPHKVPEMKWHFAAFDKGTRQPGCLGIWGVDGEGRMWLVAEVYRVGMTIDWWTNVVVELDNEFRLVAMASDHHPEWVTKFNDALMAKGRPALVENAKKDWITSVQLVQDQLVGGEDGPAIFFVRGSLRYGRCPVRDEQKLPACAVEEIPEVVWAKGVDGKPAREMMEPSCGDFDHGFDMVRYAAMWRWGKDYTPKLEAKKYAEGTLGDLWKHDELLNPRKAALRERRKNRKGPSGRWI